MTNFKINMYQTLEQADGKYSVVKMINRITPEGDCFNDSTLLAEIVATDFIYLAETQELVDELNQKIEQEK